MSTQTVSQPNLLGRFQRTRRCTVRIEAEGGVYVGKIYIPDTKRRVSDVLGDERSFLNLTDVSVDGSEILEEFVAINKNCIRTLRILDEGDTAPGPVRLV